MLNRILKQIINIEILDDDGFKRTNISFLFGLIRINYLGGVI